MIRRISTISGTAILVAALAISITLISSSVSEEYENLGVISVHEQAAQVGNITSGLVAHYTFDETSGTSAANSAGSGTGNLSGGPTWTTGKVGGALSFDGVNDRVSINDVIGTNTVTICAWVYPLNVNNGGAILSNSRFNLGVYLNNGRIYFSSNQNSGVFSSSGTIRANEWQHICAVRNSDGTGVVYNNATEIASGNSGAPVSGYGLAIGDSDGGDRPWKGSVDDVRIYNRSLSVAEITQLYNLGSGGGTVSPPVNIPPSNNTPGNSSDTTAPTVPSGLKVDSYTSSQVVLSWGASTDGVGIAGYQVNRCTGSSCTPTFFGTTAANSYTDTSVSANTSYRYTVSAYDAVPNTSAASSVVSVTTPAAPVQTSGNITATSCRDTDVSAAISSAKSGDTIQVPAGTCVWDDATAVVIPDNKKITLVGAGIGSTIIRRSSLGTALSLGRSGSRVTGFTFQLFNDGSNIAIGVYGIGWRIDHSRFESPDRYHTSILVRSESVNETPRGVIDHNEFFNTSPQVAPGISKNDPEWFTPLNLGGDQATFVEDSTFTFTVFGEAADGNYGGRLVFRYNTVMDTAIGIHSVQGGGRAMRNWEIYNNTFINSTASPRNFVFQIRGGTGVVFNNRIVGQWVNPFIFDNVRDQDRFGFGVDGKCGGNSSWDGNEPIEIGGQGQHTGSNGSNILIDNSQNWSTNSFSKVINPLDLITDTHHVWNLTDGSKGLIVANTNNTITATLSGGIRNKWNAGDRYKITNGYPCRDQIGRSSDEVLATVNNPYPPQTLDPVYMWNNRDDSGANIKATLGSVHFKLGRDIYENACRPGYTPYTYPHPLTGAAPKTQNLNCPGGSSVPSPSEKFVASDRVIVTSVNINVRNAPGTNCGQCSIAGRHTTGDTGTIQSDAQNGVYIDNLYWWKVTFDSGVSGWVSESLLLKVNPEVILNVPPTLTSISYAAQDVNPLQAGLQIYPDTTITLSAEANDTDPLTWVWVYKAGGIEEPKLTGTGRITDMTYTTSTIGTFVWYIRVTDGKDAREHQLSIEVIPRPIIYSLDTSAVNGSIICGSSTCPTSVTEGTNLILTASPIANYSFVGWSLPACPGVGSCTITVNADTVVTANFIRTSSPDQVGPTISDFTIRKLPNRALQISWTTNELATTQVEYGTDATYSSQTQLISALTSTHSVVIPNLVRGQEYHFRARSRDDSGNFTVTEDKIFKAPLKPESVLLIGAQAGSVILNWGLPVETDYTQIIIYRGEKALREPSGKPLVTLPGKVATYTDETAEPSTSYVYTIFTKDADGVISSPRSITFTTDPAPSVEDVTKHLGREKNNFTEPSSRHLSYWKRFWMTFLGILGWKLN